MDYCYALSREMNKMADKLEFSNKLRWEGGYIGDISFKNGQDFEFALPAPFGGIEGFISPEDLYVAAANACFLTTTMTRAKKYGISLESYESTASGVMEKVGDGFEITKITVKLRIKADAEKDKMDAMIKEIRGRVPVVKSMKTEVTLEAEIL